MFKVDNKNTKNELRNRLRFVGFIVNLEHISHLFLVFLLMILNKKILTRFVLGCFVCNSRLLYAIKWSVAVIFGSGR